MKSTLATLVLASTVSFACTKQPSQQPSVNSTETDGRHDISKQEGSMASPNNSGQEPVTTNPNSARSGEQSTLNTSQGAAVVGDANINPRAEGEAGQTPTSVNTDKSTEPMTDAAVNQSNCMDGKSAADCPPSSQSPINSNDPNKNVPAK